MRPSLFMAAAAAVIAVSANGHAQDLLAEGERLAEIAPGAYTEQIVTIEVDGMSAIGTLAMPAVETRQPPPVALMLHGFSGSRDELAIAGTEEGVFSRTARLWAERGLASLRIDFRGSGESEGAWEDTTFTSQIADALTAVNWLAANEAVDEDRIFVLGWSQGGLVAAAAANRHDAVARTALWAPVADPPWSYGGLIGHDTIAAALQAEGDAPIAVTLPWGAEMSLRPAFFEDLFQVDPIAEIAGDDDPLLVIVGRRDDVVTPQPQAGEQFLNYHDGLEHILVLDTDHVFDAFTGPDTLDTTALTTLGFFMAAE